MPWRISSPFSTKVSDMGIMRIQHNLVRLALLLRRSQERLEFFKQKGAPEAIILNEVDIQERIKQSIEKLKKLTK